MQPEYLATPSDNKSNGRPAGIAIALAAIAMIIFMAHHPLPSAPDTEHFIGELVHEALASAIVHGVLIGMMGLLLLGFTGLADQLGWYRLSVRAGLVAYAAGCVAMTAAALTDGFILPSLAVHYADRLSGDLEIFRASSQLLYLALAAATRLGVFSLSLAVVLWSLELVWRAGARSAVGTLGLVVGVIPIVLLLMGRLPLNFHGMLAFVVSQAAWYLAIAMQMILKRV
jgi:hypothetical protein